MDGDPQARSSVFSYGMTMALSFSNTLLARLLQTIQYLPHSVPLLFAQVLVQLHLQLTNSVLPWILAIKWSLLTHGEMDGKEMLCSLGKAAHLPLSALNLQMEIILVHLS